jgi:hypothetical protein
MHHLIGYQVLLRRTAAEEDAHHALRKRPDLLAKGQPADSRPPAWCSDLRIA